MSSSAGNVLGVCFSGNSIYYAIAEEPGSNRLAYIGRTELHFTVLDAIKPGETELQTYIFRIIDRLRTKYDAEVVRMLTFCQFECWTTLPKLAYDDRGEREAHLRYLTNGQSRDKTETYWFDLSNRDYRFLTIRNRELMKIYEQFAKSISGVDFCSDFEIGLQWVQHSGAKGSFMTLACNPHTVSVASYLLGKLRAATWLRYREKEDIPFAWKQSETHMKWMKGYHEEIVLYGSKTGRVADLLRPFWDGSADIVKMNSLELMKVEAEEKTYSFPLEEAFPAIMMAIQP